MLKQRKGITPVIAIVLLLLVTVGAVGVVYTQFQNLVDSNQASFQNQARNTHVQIDSLSSTDGGDNVTMVFTNSQNSVTINKTEMLQLSFQPNADSGYLSYASLPASNLHRSPGMGSDSEPECFKPETIAPGVTDSCTLGIKWPNVTETFGVRVSVRGGSNSDSLTCTVDTGNTISCS